MKKSANIRTNPNMGNQVAAKKQMVLFSKEYPIPGDILCSRETEESEVCDSKTSPALRRENYVSKFQSLLWREEVKARANLRKHDQSDVKLTALRPVCRGSEDSLYNNRYLLSVPSLLDDNNPRLITGSKVILIPQIGPRLWNIAYIEKICECDITICTAREIDNVEEKRFEVVFEPSRTTFIRSHKAIKHLESAGKLDAIAFPSGDEVSCEPAIDITLDSVEFFNQQLDEYQKRAVVDFLRSVRRPAPYLLFGPAGTGKTAVIVEIVLQIYKLRPLSRILVCGTSNCCVELLTSKMKSSGVIADEELLRLTNKHRKNELGESDELSDISTTVNSLSESSLRKHRVVTSTCVQASALIRFPGRYNFILVDEASHANEPETMIPFGLATYDASLLLAGDLHQLKPSCQSEIAQNNGLGASLMERLSNLEVYKEREIDGIVAHDHEYMTKLKISYRCDPRLMAISNAMFYDNQLEFKAETPEHLLEKLEVRNPLIFHAIEGKEERPPRQTSWCNEDEAYLCLKYVEKLYKMGLKSDQVGIITPYRAQIRKINRLFDLEQLAKCRVDIVGKFNEREVIIISMVRTTPQNDRGEVGSLDFLFDENRFNVAISRARWVCISIGNPEVLERYKCWNKYMKAAQKVES